jgi:hypothetical protein
MFQTSEKGWFVRREALCRNAVAKKISGVGSLCLNPAPPFKTGDFYDKNYAGAVERLR